jgi:hypothetical protein
MPPKSQQSILDERVLALSAAILRMATKRLEISCGDDRFKGPSVALRSMT